LSQTAFRLQGCFLKHRNAEQQQETFYTVPEALVEFLDLQSLIPTGTKPPQQSHRIG
jgi:hypothetical protein